jgi:hypothetical protein
MRLPLRDRRRLLEAIMQFDDQDRVIQMVEHLTVISKDVETRTQEIKQ